MGPEPFMTQEEQMRHRALKVEELPAAPVPVEADRLRLAWGGLEKQVDHYCYISQYEYGSTKDTKVYRKD